MRRRSLASLLLGLALVVMPVVGRAQTNDAPITSYLAIDQKIGKPVAADVKLRDEHGTPVTLQSYLGERPLLVVPVEFGYEGSSALINDSLMRVLGKAGRRNQMRLGRDLDVVILSIKPDEQPELGLAEKHAFAESIDSPTYFNPLRGAEPKRAPSQPDIEAGLHYLVGDLAAVTKVTESLGFKFKYSPKEGILANPLGTVFVSKDGVITGYTIGNEVVTKFAELNLADAANGRLSEPADTSQKFAVIKVSPTALKNRPIIENVYKIAGWSTLVALMGSIAYMSFKYRTPAIPSRGPNQNKPGGPQASA